MTRNPRFTHSLRKGETFSPTRLPFADCCSSHASESKNYNSSVIYIRHVESGVPGLTRVKTFEWSTQRPDFARSSLRETITYRVGQCSLVPRGSADTTLQTRTYNGTSETIRLSLMGPGNAPWQLGMFNPLCLALPK